MRRQGKWKCWEGLWWKEEESDSRTCLEWRVMKDVAHGTKRDEMDGRNVQNLTKETYGMGRGLVNILPFLLKIPSDEHAHPCLP